MKEIGLSFLNWDGDHTKFYPMSISTNFGGTLEWIQRGEVFRPLPVMSNELATPMEVACPADTRQLAKDFGSTFNNTDVSHFVGVDADESNLQMLLSGDRNIVGGTKRQSGILEIETDQSVGWSSEIHNGMGNVAFADGSVQQTASSNLILLIIQTGLATNQLAIP